MTRKFKDEPNWVNDVLGLRVKYKLPLNDNNIRKMSVDDWDTYVKIAVRIEVFLQLQVKLPFNKKNTHIVYHLFKTSDYFFSYLLL